jgi:hypothetical protein
MGFLRVFSRPERRFAQPRQNPFETACLKRRHGLFGQMQSIGLMGRQQPASSVAACSTAKDCSMKTLVALAVLMASSQAVWADDVVARSVRRGDTIVTTTDRGVYTTQIQRNATGSTSETRFQRAAPQGFAGRSTYNPMTH